MMFPKLATPSPIDLFAGLSIASILLPEAVAYAAIAHLPILSAITAVMAGLVCYAIIGASRFAVVAPTSSSAALVAAAALSLSTPGTDERAALSFALVVLTGIGLLVVATARLGRLSAFVSRPVLHGFSFALATTIIVKQLPIMLGVSASGANPFSVLASLATQSRDWSWWSLATGLAALLMITGLKRLTRLPAAFIVLASGIGLSYSVDLTAWHIATVGTIGLALPHPGLPQLTVQQWLNTGELAGGLLVILFAESWGSIRSLALRHGDQVEPNRELYALGAANLVSGLIQGMPVGAGFSASSANEAAGAQSKMAGLFAAAMVLLLAVFGKNLIEHIPEPVLAAAVIGALLHALNPQPILFLWRLNRDQYLALAALAAVLFFGVLHGMLIAVALSLASAIRTFSLPNVRELTELGQTRNYVDRENHPEAVVRPHILILRPEEPLFFASIDGILDEIRSQIQQRKECRILILSLEQSGNLDSSATENLMELAHTLQQQGITLLLARVKDAVRQLLMSSAAELFDARLFWSVADAAAAADLRLLAVVASAPSALTHKGTQRGAT